MARGNGGASSGGALTDVEKEVTDQEIMFESVDCASMVHEAEIE